MKAKLSLLARGAALAACAFGLAGCISSSGTSYRDVKRAKVDFESEKAGRVFYEAMSRMPFSERHDDRTTVTIPVVFHYTETVKTGDNEKFNEAVRRCDTNKDGRITEAEADIFASQYH